MLSWLERLNELIKLSDDMGCHIHCLNEYKWNVRFNVLMVRLNNVYNQIFEDNYLDHCSTYCLYN